MFPDLEAYDGLNQKQKRDAQSSTHDLITILARRLMKNLKKLEGYASEILKGEDKEIFEAKERFISSLGLVQPIFGGGLFLVFLIERTLVRRVLLGLPKVKVAIFSQ